ncbi:hypothetical protein BD770DRAFT_466065 [Pilaira anomala]|nr:hypothetical protein BD770DRAFT_466065 [Pilaira anomala]
MEGSVEQYTSVNTLSINTDGNDKKVMTVKSSITGIGWKPQYLSILKKLVHDVHVIVTHTYSFTRYIFIQELNLNLEEYAVQGFYKEVFLSLLDNYREKYCRDSSFTPIKLPSAQQIASYEATKIQTACTNAITKDFGNKLRMAVNQLIGLKQRISQLTSDLKKQSYSEEETKAKIKSNILEPATQLKLAISSRDISRIPKEFQDQKAIINCIKDIFSAYPETYKFKKDSIYYDAVENPGKHLLAYFKLAEICEANKVYLGKSPKFIFKTFKDQGLNSSMKFRGTIMTDGIGISVIKQNFDTSKGGTSNSKASLVEDEELKYIEQIPNEELRSTDGKCVFIDPGRRDLIYCMHEDSTVSNKKIYRAEVTSKMQEYYSNEGVEKDKRKKELIPFRKMKLSADINEIQSTKRLSKNIRKKFGKDCILILGNWSVSRTRFHEPIKGNGLRNSLQKEGFKVYLLDEFKTSSICPSCENKLSAFKECINPRLYRCSTNPKVTCHGLLRCLNQNCLEKQALTEKDQDNIKYRLWNRDLAAVLNFRKIVISFRTTSQKPAIFSRSQKDSIKRKNSEPIKLGGKTLVFNSNYPP